MFHVSLSGKDITHKFDTLPEALLWVAQQGDEFELRTYRIWSVEECRPIGSLTV